MATTDPKTVLGEHPLRLRLEGPQIDILLETFEEVIAKRVEHHRARCEVCRKLLPYERRNAR
jgi:hypothetical protein